MRKRERHQLALREFAAVWCSILASDRATDAWSIKLLKPHAGPPALRIAWRYFRFSQLENTIRLSSPDTAAERWARAEAILRAGPL